MLLKHVVLFANSSFATNKVLNLLDRISSQIPIFYIERNLEDSSSDELVQSILEHAAHSVPQMMKVA